MSSFDPGSQGIPRSSDGAPNWAADTDPVGPVTPEPASIHAGPTQNLLQKEESMSTAEFGDPTLAAGLAPPSPDGLISPMVISAPALPGPGGDVAPLLAPPLNAAPPATPPVAPVAPVNVEAAAPAIAAADMRDVPLGTLIFRAGLLTEEQLEEALQDGMQRGKRLGEVLLERGLVSENDLGRMLAGQKGLQFVELDSASIDPTAVQLLPVEKARLHTVLPIGFHEGLPVVAVADPSNDLVVENVRRALNCEPHLVVAGREALQRQIEVAHAAAPAPAPVAQEHQPVSLSPLPEPVAEAAPLPAPPAQPLEPLVATPAAPMAVTPTEPLAETPDEPVDGGVWLGVPDPAPQEPVVSFQPSELQPLVAEPVPPLPEPVAEAPVVQPLPEPVAISFTPVAPVEPVVETVLPLPVAEAAVAPPDPVATPEPVVVAGAGRPTPIRSPLPTLWRSWSLPLQPSLRSSRKLSRPPSPRFFPTPWLSPSPSFSPSLSRQLPRRHSRSRRRPAATRIRS